MATQPNNVVGITQPELKELVSIAVLRHTGVNAQAFSGAMNPSTIYRQMVANDPNVYQYYRELEEKDLTIAGAIETRKILAMARQATVQAADPDNGTAMMYSEEATAFLELIPGLRWTRWEQLDAPYYGLKVQEILWRAGLSIEKIISRPQELFSFGLLTDPQIGPLRLSAFPGGQGQPVPETKFLVSTYQPRDGDRRGRPLARRLFWPSWFVRNVLRLHLKFLEKGPGTVGVKYPAGSSDAEKDKALDVSEAIANELYVAMHENLQVVPELLTQTRTRDANDFNTLADRMESAMTRMVLGQTLATRGAEGGFGSRAAGEVHMQVLWEYIASDLADQEEVINDQLLKPWGLWRFGPQFLARAFRPYWRADKQPPKDRGQELDLLAKARNMGAEVPTSEVYEKGGIRTPDEGERTLPPPALSVGISEDLRPALAALPPEATE